MRAAAGLAAILLATSPTPAAPTTGLPSARSTLPASSVASELPEPVPLSAGPIVAQLPAPDRAYDPDPLPTLGRLFFTEPGRGEFVCSANVVTSQNRDVIATARHCVMDITNGRTYTNFRFAPGYDRGGAPYGWWGWRTMLWRTDDLGPGGDNAFIVLSTGGATQQHVQDVVGGTGIAFDQPVGAYARAVGIPADSDSAITCAGRPVGGPNGGVQLADCPNLGGGASGGALLDAGNTTQTGTFYGDWGEPYFAAYRSAAWQIYNRAQSL